VRFLFWVGEGRACRHGTRHRLLMELTLGEERTKIVGRTADSVSAPRLIFVTSPLHL
jgi:hypothetical protein